MMLLYNILIIIAVLLLTPIAVGLILGIDRKITAKCQSRKGPPLLQPFFDLFKLFGKEHVITNRWQYFCTYIYLVSAQLAIVLLFLGADLLLIFFVQASCAVFLVIGAMAVPSPYSQIGAHRELLQVLTYEPLLILIIIGIYMTTGSFMVDAVFAVNRPLLYDLPLMIVVLGYVLTIKLRKSPFDIASSHHAHQEIVRGVHTEFAGGNFGIVELAHWYEIGLALCLCMLFWATSIWGALAVLAIAFFLEILVDNISARMTWSWMLFHVWLVGFTLAAINLIWLYMR